MSDLAESRLGRYRLLKLLGRGGMGEVHLAHDDMLDRHVAIKFVAIGKQSDPEARRRLVREAQAAASLDHPSICPVYEVGEAPDGRAYIVMQYVEGETLSARLAQGAMPAREALDICVHIADALAVAHRHGIIHRDLKSSNVMVTPSGLPKLLDFGIAKAVVLPVSAAEAPTLQNDTSDGIILGTPGSMSPEQVQQRPLDGRSDLFALGTLLYECLTGRRPFDARTTLEIIANVLHAQPPAPSSLRADVTEQHDALCLRLMAKEPADRFQSAEEVVGAARLLLSESLRGGTGGVRGPIAPPGTALPGMRGRVLLGAAVAAAWASSR